MAHSQLASSYSNREILDRYESGEDDFLRELEDLQESIQREDADDDVPQDPAPILSVLCSLVDEIGSLRTENRRLKSRARATPPAPKNVVQRMSALLDSRGQFFPRFRRSAHQEIRNGARERLASPPRKDCLTTSSISTDLSQSSGRNREVPLVEPELSDSDLDEHIYKEMSSSPPRRARRDSIRRREASLSECTSPSSASSSRDPSEAMTSSRSSFFELLGLRRRPPTVVAPPSPMPSKPILKKRRRRISEDDTMSSNNYLDNNDNSHTRCRPPSKPPRPASYYRREESEDSDNRRPHRKATSFLNVHHNHYENTEALLRVDRETKLRSQIDNLTAEIEEHKMRNTRLVEQLREKSAQFSKLQCHTHKLEEQLELASNRLAFSEALDRMTLEERIFRGAQKVLEKVEEKIRHFDGQVQTIKLSLANTHQMAFNVSAAERQSHLSCQQRLDQLQRENNSIMLNRYVDTGGEDVALKRRLEQLPSYEELYAFTSGVVKKFADLRWHYLEKSADSGRAELDLIAAQSTLLVAHTQAERLRIAGRLKKRRRRPASYHGENILDRLVDRDMSFFMPFKLQGSRVENMRKMRRRKPVDVLGAHGVEQDFLAFFAHPKVSSPEKATRPVSRIESMKREMSNIGRVRHAINAISKDENKSDNRRPISLVEVEEQKRFKRFEETRRSIKGRQSYLEQLRLETSSDELAELRAAVSSLQDVAASTRSPLTTPMTTPLLQRRLFPMERKPPDPIHDHPLRSEIRSERGHRLERGFSTESRNDDRSNFELREANRARETLERARDEARDNEQGVERRQSRIQRSLPVHVTRIRPPSQNNSFKTRTMDSQNLARNVSIKVEGSQGSRTLDVSRTLEGTRNLEPKDPPPSRLMQAAKKSWLDKLKSIKKS